MIEGAQLGTRPNQTENPQNQAHSPDSADSLLQDGILPLSPSSTTPQDVWDDYFRKRSPEPEAVREVVLRLHEGRKHEHVIAVIRAALIHGEGQPWMYEVLALTLEIQGAAKSEVERALLSQIDSAKTDAAGLMMSAAYLTRFNADKPALRLYRQASELSPERPEPHILGLNLAKRLQDDEALIWAVNGIYMTVWGEGYKQQHRKAEIAVAERARQLRDGDQHAKADKLTNALERAKRVDVRVRLEWSGNGDLDLRVHEPSGTVCSVETLRTTGGGVLVHDGHGPNQANCFDEYVCAAGFSGTYRIEIRHSWGDIVGKRAKLIVTTHEGMKHETSKVFTVPVTDEGTSVRIALTDGRREEALNLPEEIRSSSKQPTVSQLLSRLDSNSADLAERFEADLFRQLGGLNTIGGAGAVGYQPQVTELATGVRLGAQAVVSADRRYVRLSLSPNFSEVIDVFTFSFVSGN